MYKKINAIIESIERTGLIDISIINNLRHEVCLLKAPRDVIDSNNNGLNDFLESILNRIPDPVFIKDENHIWIFLNDSACELFGFKREELIGKSDYDIFISEEADVYWKVDNEVFTTGKEIRNEEYQTHPITKKRRVLDTKKTLSVDERGNKILIGIIRDITEQKQAVEDMQEAIASKEKIFSIIAHDLKEPFNTLIGFSGLLQKNYDKYDDEKRKYFIENLNAVANNTYAFIQNILDWAAAQTGKLAYKPESFSIKTILDEILILFAESVKKKEIKIIIADYLSNINVCADKNMVQTILRNLLMNAIKFTPIGGKIIVNIEKLKSKIKLCIADNGIGISKNQAENLFNNKAIIPKSGTSGEKGIGLGLLLCSEFVEINKGEIWYKPNKPKGSCFCFTLPEGDRV
jgi:PAS domain S-box-containing protein